MTKAVLIAYVTGALSGGGATWYLHAKALAALQRIEAALATLKGK